MLLFWIAAVLLSAAAAALIVRYSARELQAGPVDPAAAVYRRQLEEIDELAGRGLLVEEERQAAHAEAARRLISASEAAPESADAGSVRAGVIAATALAFLAAGVLYLMVGKAGAADQPFAKRMEAWRQTDPTQLSAEQLAVLLKKAVENYPKDPQPLFMLARAQLASGQDQAAIRSMQHAVQLAPGRADLWAGLGETQVTADGKVSAAAEKSFAQAVALDPSAPLPRYFLGLARIDRGDVEGGLGIWRAIAAELPAGDPKLAAIREEIAEVERTGGRALAAPAPGADPAVAAMVEGLAERLKDNPDDPAGWQRLVRSYAVLGDRAKLEAALTEARRIYKDRPAERAAIEAAVNRPAPSPTE